MVRDCSQLRNAGIGRRARRRLIAAFLLTRMHSPSTVEPGGSCGLASGPVRRHVEQPKARRGLFV